MSIARIIYADTTYPIAEYHAAYRAACQYLRRSARGLVVVNAVLQSSVSFTLRIGATEDATFRHDTATIIWNPDVRLDLRAGGRRRAMSSALSLLHEFGHAVQWIEDPVWYRLHANGQDYIAYIEEENVAKNEVMVANDIGEPARARYQDNYGTRPFVGAAAQRPLAERVLLHG